MNVKLPELLKKKRKKKSKPKVDLTADIKQLSFKQPFWLYTSHLREIFNLIKAPVGIRWYSYNPFSGAEQPC